MHLGEESLRGVGVSGAPYSNGEAYLCVRPDTGLKCLYEFSLLGRARVGNLSEG